MGLAQQGGRPVGFQRGQQGTQVIHRVQAAGAGVGTRPCHIEKLLETAGVRLPSGFTTSSAWGFWLRKFSRKPSRSRLPPVALPGREIVHHTFDGALLCAAGGR